MNDIYPVRISINGTTKHYSPEFQTAERYRAGWHRALQGAYGRGEASCGCGGPGPARLAIKHLSASNMFYLARFAQTGMEHAPGCQFWSTASIDGSGTNLGEVVKDRGDGSVQIRLALGMTVPTPAAAESNRAPSHGPRRSGQSAMRLLGLLHYLWVEAGLNCWRKGWETLRTKRTVMWRIERAAASVIVGTRELDSVLLLPAESPISPDATRNAARVSAAIAVNGRMIVIAPLARHSDAQAAAMEGHLKIRGFHGMPPIFLKSGVWSDCAHRHPAAIAAWKRHTPVIAIAQIELTASAKGTRANALDLALMPITENWIPVESTHEHAVARRLVDEKRSFRKPMRFDSSTDAILPDFILEDTVPATPCEVFGMSHPDYIARRDEKRRIYEAKYGRGGWWEWDAAAIPDQASMPAFPPPS